MKRAMLRTGDVEQQSKKWSGYLCSGVVVEMGRGGSRPHKVMVPIFYILSLGPWMAQGVKIMCCKSCLLRGRLLLHCNCNMRDTDKA